MKVSLVFLASVAFACAVSVQKVNEITPTSLHEQLQVLELLHNVHQVSTKPEHVEISKQFNPMDHHDLFIEKDAVVNFTLHYEDGLVPRDAVFSIYYDEHLKQAIALFHMFYHAKDWDTFYKTAVWARQHVHPAMFVYSFYVNIVHHPKTAHIYLPPIYEVIPHYFFSSEVIQKAHQYKMMHEAPRSENHQERHWHTIEANYSGHYLNLHPEQYLSSWMEDVEINAHNFYHHVNFPFWLNTEKFGFKNTRRGEIFILSIQNILGRYYMERLSNDFGHIPEIHYDEHIHTPYVPSLVYPNGLKFPERPMYAKIHHEYSQKRSYVQPICSVGDLYQWESRVNDAIDGFRVYYQHNDTKVHLTETTGHEVVGNLLEGNAESPSWKYYGRFMSCARRLYGYAHEPLDVNHVAASALEHEETAMRDPVYYQLLKKLMRKYRRFTMHLHPYTKEQLTMPGVKVEKVEVDDLVTYDDWSHFDLTNAVYYGEHEKHHEFQVRARQSRLNHKPFSINAHVHSDKDQEVVVKIFMVPSQDEYRRHINITDNIFNVVLMEHFKHQLKVGDNVITYNSQDNKYVSPDRMSFFELYHKVRSAMEEKSEFHVHAHQNSFVWPQRYVLPRGHEQGFPVKFAVYVYPVVHSEDVERHLRPNSHKEMYVDELPMLYPFDRFVEHEHVMTHIPNLNAVEKLIFHKDVHDVNAPHHH